MTLNKFLRYFVLAGVFLVPFVVIIVGGTILFPNSFFPFITGKNFVLRIIIELIAGAWLILALRDRNYAPKKSWILWAMSAFLIVMLAADIFSVNPLKSFWSNFERMEGFVTLIHLAVYFLVASTVLNTRKLWNWFWHTSIGVSFFMCLYGFLQVKGELPIDQGSTRVDGTLGNAAYLAVYLLIHIFILTYFLMSKRGAWRANIKYVVTSYIIGFGTFICYYVGTLIRDSLEHVTTFSSYPIGATLCIISLLGIIGAAFILFQNTGSNDARDAGANSINTDSQNSPVSYFSIVLYCILIAFETYMMIETATRGTALGFVAGVLFIAVVFAFFERERRAVRNTGIVILAVAVLSIVGVFSLKNEPIIKNSASLSRLSTLATFNVNNLLNDGGEARLLIWKMAWDGFKQKPILGWGQESFNYVFYKYYSPQMYSQEPWFDRAHDVFLDWLVDGGILGLLTYLSLFAGMLWYVWRKPSAISGQDSKDSKNSVQTQSEPFDLVERTVLTGLLIGYFIHNIFVFDNIGSYILFFSLVAYVHSVYSQPFNIQDGKSQNKAAGSGKTSADDEGAQDIIAAVILAITLAIVYFVNVPAIRESLLLVDAISPQQSSSQESGIEQNLAIFKEVFAEPTFIGKYEAREQLVQIAIEAAQATPAQISDTDKTDLYNYAYSQMQEQLKETPQDLRYYYFMGSLLDAYSQWNLALPIWQTAVSLSPSRQLMLINLGQVQAQLGDSTDALANFQKAYNLEPDYTDAAILYFEASQQYAKLIPLLQQAVTSDPTDLNSAMSLTDAYLKSGDNKDAIAELNQIAKYNPQYASQVQTFVTDIQEGKPLQ